MKETYQIRKGNRVCSTRKSEKMVLFIRDLWHKEG